MSQIGQYLEVYLFGVIQIRIIDPRSLVNIFKRSCKCRHSLSIHKDSLVCSMHHDLNDL